MIDEGTKKRFWSKVDVQGKDDCWEWMASKNNQGYGQLSKGNGKSPWKAHRLSWMISNGPIPKKMYICHHCDNPGCVNPNHLFAGTAFDNAMDMYIKGRAKMYKHGTGENNNSAKFTKDQIKQIRKDYCNGMTYKEISKKYNTSNVPRIVRNIAYYDPNYKLINANAKKRPWREVVPRDKIDYIKELRKDHGYLLKDIAEMFGVSTTTISYILRKKEIV